MHFGPSLNPPLLSQKLQKYLHEYMRLLIHSNHDDSFINNSKVLFEDKKTFESASDKTLYTLKKLLGFVCPFVR